MRVPVLLAALGAAAVPPASCQDVPIRLVVLVAVDQLRPDYFDRFKQDFTAGFRRLRDGSAFFPRGEQDHAITETAPGHATMLSGRSPASTGIVANALGVPDTLSPLLGVPGPGASPRRFRGTALYDWMRAVDPEVRALSVSRKDRGAILPIGRARVPVFWYHSGYYTTSTWYADSLPTWLRQWNGRQGAHRLAGHTWDLLLPADRYAAPDSQPWERGGQGFLFPHRLSLDTTRAVQEIIATPWSDSLTLDLALEGTRQLGLGRRDRPDLLVVSLSATDAVGHLYGPDSRELHDHLVRLDRWLGWFMDSLASLVPGDRILWALTSDHGVTPFPESLRSQGRIAGRADGAEVAAAVRRTLEARLQGPLRIGFDNGLLYADVSRLRAAGVDVDSLSDAVASQLTRITGVTMVWTPRRLARADTTDLGAMRWRRSIPADFEWLAAATLAPGYIWSYSAAGTTHGTPNADDVRVPILFLGPGIAPATYERRVRTMDIGPTIAALLGIRPTEPVEGVVLAEVIGGR